MYKSDETPGIVTASTVANIGEAGREAVLPLDNNTEWMDMLADRIGGSRKVPVNINLNYDGETFARVSIPDILSELNRQGYDIDVLGAT